MSTSLPAGVPATHPAVAITALHTPITLIERSTEAPGPGEVLIHVTWTSSTPLDLHQADGGLLITTPFVMGSSFAGTIVALGAASEDDEAHHQPPLQTGDAVFGFDFRDQKARGHQTYITTSAYMVSRVPPNLAPEEAVAVSVNLVTAFHVLTADLGLALPWPVQKAAEDGRTAPILVWGAASSVGNYVLQVLKHWGYENAIAVASAKHHAYLRTLGAAATFDYNDADVTEKVLASVEARSGQGPRLPYIVDCIGSLEGTLRPLSKVADKGSKVAIMLPVINVHAREDRIPEYEMDVAKVLPGEWRDGVELHGTRTHHYLENKLFKDRLQSEIIPVLLEQGAITPNKIRVVEGNSLLERAKNALSLLRNQAPSGEKLVWRVADES